MLDIFPAGSYVKSACTSAHERGTCEICDFDTYTEHDNGLPQCLKCTKCRPGNSAQVWGTQSMDLESWKLWTYLIWTLLSMLLFQTRRLQQDAPTHRTQSASVKRGASVPPTRLVKFVKSAQRKCLTHLQTKSHLNSWDYLNCNRKVFTHDAPSWLFSYKSLRYSYRNEILCFSTKM